MKHQLLAYVVDNILLYKNHKNEENILSSIMFVGLEVNTDKL
jgi:hypothetical protein